MCTSETGTRDQKRGLRNARLVPRSSFLVPQLGISLVELIMFIVIVGIALAGLLLVLNIGVKGSADPLLRKQAQAIAESLLEEIGLQNYSKIAGGYSGSDRSQFDCIMDYNGYATTGVYQVDGSAVPGLENYSVSVSVASAALGSISSSSAALITVTVTDPAGQTVEAAGYRAKF